MMPRCLAALVPALTMTLAAVDRAYACDCALDLTRLALVPPSGSVRALAAQISPVAS